MKKAFRASRLSFLFALVLGLTAFSATAAQAEPGAFWKVNGVQLKSPLLPEVQAVLEKNDGILLTKVGASSIEILCTALALSGAKLQFELGQITGKMTFTGCITKLNGGAANGACKPHSPGAAEGTIVTNALVALLKLHILKDAGGKEIGKDDLIKLSPAVGLTFVTLVLGPEVGSECAIGKKFDITGHLYLEDCLKDLLTELVTHLLQEGPLTELFFGGSVPVKFDGSFNVSLTGIHNGLTWSGWPF